MASGNPANRVQVQSSLQSHSPSRVRASHAFSTARDCAKRSAPRYRPSPIAPERQSALHPRSRRHVLMARLHLGHVELDITDTKFGSAGGHVA